MKTLRLLLAAVLALAPVAPAVAFDRPLNNARIKDNGDVQMSDDLRIGSSKNGQFTARSDGLVVRKRSHGFFGAYDDAVGSLLMLGDAADEPAPITGGSENGIDAGGIKGYASTDAVGDVLKFTPPQPLAVVPGTFDQTHFYPSTPLTSAQLAGISVGYTTADGKRRPGSWLQAEDGRVSWVVAKSATALTVYKGWWQLGTQSATYGTPTGTQKVAINVFTKGFGINWTYYHPATAYQDAGYLAEYDVYNFKPNARVDNTHFVAQGYIENQVVMRGAAKNQLVLHDCLVSCLSLRNTVGQGVLLEARTGGDTGAPGYAVGDGTVTFQLLNNGNISGAGADFYGPLVSHVATADQSVYAVPASGSVVAIPNGVSWVHLYPGNGNANGQEVVFPPNPINGQNLEISTAAGFTALFYLHGGSGIAVSEPSAPTVKTAARFRYLAPASTWVRLN